MADKLTAPDFKTCPFCEGETENILGAGDLAKRIFAVPNPAAIREAALREAIEAYPRSVGAILALIPKEATNG